MVYTCQKFCLGLYLAIVERPERTFKTERTLRIFHKKLTYLPSMQVSNSCNPRDLKGAEHRLIHITLKKLEPSGINTVNPHDVVFNAVNPHGVVFT